MKNNSQKSSRTITSYLFCLFTGLLATSSLALSGEWSTEKSLSGMDSVHIYQPTTTPIINNKRALMINLHGCIMSNTDMKDNAGWSSTADQFGMVVALPDVPGKGAFSLACWNYYGGDHSRTNKHNRNIINLANELINRPELNIDPSQVYITGFSSGGGQANVIACLAPEIFSGVGSASGPGLATTATQYASVPEDYSSANQAKLCQQLAGENAPYLNTQLYSTIHGSDDKVVDPQFNLSAANIMASVYHATNESPATVIKIDAMNVIFSDAQGPRVSKIILDGVGHNWSSSVGNTGYFVNNKVDYPAYVTQWFFDNNRRIKPVTVINAN